ncbi:SPT3 Dosage dependent suppressor of Ty-induced promoter mutations-like protein [Linnemannia schmuckeri]|uniref:SPT3 Dosage dependent suppressor of Ty-induced promoter mutations-like protein n=1 Tax=Linnemannia schmuckeri TaxID=64567 RepID=A0A9P5S4I3_9FUNG|nr:SPT3 Dosage dependent suppressor of Ty-induced promoter mutations-like protein [Linnemannia schmuckeri]
MPPHSSNLLQALGQSDLSAFDTSFLHHHHEDASMSELKKNQLVSPEWNNALLFSLNDTLSSFNKPTVAHRLNVKTHVFKKELQEYVPTQIEDRLRIETIIYVELSIVDHNNNLINAYDFARLPKDLFFSQPDKIMSSEEMATKRIIDIAATLQCPSNNWQEEKEACLRCARRMSAKLDQTESRIMHMLPELHRTDNGDALISFRSGVANIQFKINCYCGHKKEKEGFVIRFDSQSDISIASHVTLPLMFYHQNKNRVASRALAAASKVQGQSDQPLQDQGSTVRSVVKSVTSKSKKESRTKFGSSPIGQHHQIPSPPNSLLDSPVEWSSSPEMEDFIDNTDIPFTVPSPPPPDPLISLFPESIVRDEQQQQPTITLISHMTPNSGPIRGGTLVTIHGSGFKVGELIYVCFGENLAPVIPQRDHMLECVTPASNKAETVAVFVMNSGDATTAQATFAYIDDNEKELMKLALQRMLSVATRMEGPLDTVLNRANEFTLWSDLLESNLDGSSSLNGTQFSNLEDMVIESLKALDTPTVKNVEGLSISNSTGHTLLHLAVALQYQALVKELMDRGIDMSVMDKNGLTALALARHLNSQIMVDLLCGVESSTSAGDTITATVAPKITLLDTKVGLSGEGDEAARGLSLFVSPGSQATATDQPCTDHGSSGIVPSSGVPTKNPTLDLAGQDDPHMDFVWEGFGQGPGHENLTLSDDVARSKMLSLFDQQEPRRFGGAVDQFGQQQQQEQDYRKTLSAIPTGSGEVMMSMPEQDYETPAVGRRLVGKQDAQPTGITDATKFNIPIGASAFASCPIRTLESTRLPVGGLDQAAPIGQDEVAAEGCTGVASVNPSVGVPGNGSSQSIQGIGRIDRPTVRIPIRVGDGSETFSTEQQRSAPVGYIAGICPTVHQAEVSGVVVVSEEMETDNDAGGSLNTATEQAAVQSSRQDDVESEPLLFLGGLPVTLLPRPTRTTGPTVPSPTVAVNRSANSGSNSSEPSKMEHENDVEQA